MVSVVAVGRDDRGGDLVVVDCTPPTETETRLVKVVGVRLPDTLTWMVIGL